MYKIQNLISSKFIGIFLLAVLFFIPSVALGADVSFGDNVKMNSSLSGSFSGAGSDLSSSGSELKDTYDALYDSAKDETDTTKKSYMAAQMDMLYRQMDAIDSYDNMKDRVDALGKDDTRKDEAESLLKTANTAVVDFVKLDATESDGASGYTYISSDTYKAESAFNKAEKAAIKAVGDVNQYLLSPKRPGTSKKNGKDVGGVPTGDLIEDFIPGAIRILFRFASLAVLISFVVSGVMFVMVFGEEERITKAKNMLYYSLIGFAFVSLAFAIVKAVTDIDFFGFI